MYRFLLKSSPAGTGGGREHAQHAQHGSSSWTKLGARNLAPALTETKTACGHGRHLSAQSSPCTANRGSCVIPYDACTEARVECCSLALWPTSAHHCMHCGSRVQLTLTSSSTDMIYSPRGRRSYEKRSSKCVLQSVRRRCVPSNGASSRAQATIFKPFLPSHSVTFPAVCDHRRHLKVVLEVRRHLNLYVRTMQGRNMPGLSNVASQCRVSAVWSAAWRRCRGTLTHQPVEEQSPRVHLLAVLPAVDGAAAAHVHCM